jgi:hypothetical protein
MASCRRSGRVAGARQAGLERALDLLAAARRPVSERLAGRTRLEGAGRHGLNLQTFRPGRRIGLEGPKEIALQDLDLLLNVGQRLAAKSDQTGAAPVGGQRALEREFTLFHAANERFELGTAPVRRTRAAAARAQQGLPARQPGRSWP